jgi:hypothetical protein
MNNYDAERHVTHKFNKWQYRAKNRMTPKLILGILGVCQLKEEKGEADLHA